MLLLTVLISCTKTEDENSVISTKEISDISVNSARGGGSITSFGSLPVLARGLCWSFKENPTIFDSHSSDSVGSSLFTTNITNLNSDSTYYVRAYCINKKDTVYGNQVKFKTLDYIIFNPNLSYGSVTDIDGNVYKTITIGTQTWMAENLKVTHYRNGDSISNVKDSNKWGFFEITYVAYCWFKNNISNKNVHGAFYNWYAATDSRNIAPLGWHVASSDEWETLCKNLYININSTNPYKLRETTTAHWKYLDLEASGTNESGFTALPCGKRDGVNRDGVNYDFMGAGIIAYFWTKTGTMDGSRSVYLNTTIVINSLEYNCRGFSIRCVKDQFIELINIDGCQHAKESGKCNGKGIYPFIPGKLPGTEQGGLTV